jgi:hypothetical protein
MNDALRDHVTSAAFALTLGKTHIAELVRLDLELAAGRSLAYSQVRNIPHRAHRLDVPARNALAARGLISHVFDEEKWHPDGKPSREWTDLVTHGEFPPSENWAITRAGEHVIGLLREAGLYQEYAGPLLPLIEAGQEERRAS